MLPYLEKLGAIPTTQRVVEHLDQRIITAAGVSSGIDMALRLSELLVDRTAAEAMQLGIEYDPQPPFDCGHPDKASDDVKTRLAEYAQMWKTRGIRSWGEGWWDMPLTVGNNVHVCLDFDDAAEMTRRFDALAAGGQVNMPLQDTFWGARFGMLTDAYGIRWMFNCNLKHG